MMLYNTVKTTISHRAVSFVSTVEVRILSVSEGEASFALPARVSSLS